jgi:hypothetical protein
MSRADGNGLKERADIYPLFFIFGKSGEGQRVNRLASFSFYFEVALGGANFSFVT